ncbi:MAG: ABC transporter substrate-binding protein [Sulfurospirillaceae bacterium]|nr:ABC transporter substrate-binding protein [Sulfurospirillaceae bacterium]
MKYISVILLFSTWLIASSIPPCSEYQGKPKYIAGKSPAVNMLIQSINHFVFPEKISKNDPTFKKIDDVETLAKEGVDLVVLWNSNDNYQDLAQKLSQIGIAACSLNLDTLDQYPNAIMTLGRIMQAETRAQDLATFMQSRLEMLNELRAKIPQEKRLRVYYARGSSGLQSACASSSHAEIITIAGGINPIECSAMAKALVSLNPEMLLKINPDVIITDNKEFFDTLHDTASIFQYLKAVTTSQIYLIPNKPANWADSPPSLLRLLGAMWLFKQLYPNEISYDLDREIKQFKRLYLNQGN